MIHPIHASAPTQRLISLDVLRGMTIAFMILVNNNGGSGSWAFMNHAEWNGITVTDLVFPTFLFVVGASIVFAFAARLARGATRSQLVLHTLRRAATLFALGLVISGFPYFDLTHLRVYGVLQRIAICYLMVSLFYLWDRRVGSKVAAVLVLLVGYWVLLRWVPVPGAGMPGRDIGFLDQNQNLASWIDRHLMAHRLWLSTTAPSDFGGLDHNLSDPEGLLSTLPALATTLLGVLTGLWLRTSRLVRQKALGLAAATAVCLASGYLWSVWFPLNKNLWTSSYVLVAAGWSLALLTVIYWAAEVNSLRKSWTSKWTWPWIVLGSNAITAYFLSEVLGGGLASIHLNLNGQKIDVLSYLFEHSFARIHDPGSAAFSYFASFLVVCFVLVWILYRKRIFVKI
jgi:predicted acyltransferase